MRKQGLCISCASNEKCILFKQSPVLQCEEFTSYANKSCTKKRRKVRRQNRKK